MTRSTESGPESWYVVHTKPQAEETALFNLRRQGYLAYLPRYAKRRRHARRVDYVRAPLFPRYLFVRFDTQATPWRPIISTVGVRYLVMHGDTPTRVPEGVVEEIQGREDENHLVQLSLDGFRRSDPVEIVAGPFAGLTGLFDSVCDKRRSFVLLDLLGRQVKTLVPTEMVTAAA